jgi:hypothetical protein
MTNRGSNPPPRPPVRPLTEGHVVKRWSQYRYISDSDSPGRSGCYFTSAIYIYSTSVRRTP